LNQGNRIIELDSLRGIAAIMVVIYHYTSRFFEIFKLPNTAFYKFSFGHLGVELFFMISGFVILMSLDKVSNGWEFIKKRFLRLYPSYWVAVLFTFAVLSIVGLPGRETTTVQALVNLTMLHEFFGIPHVDGVYWSLTVELSFYALVFLSLFFNKSLFIKWGWVLLLILSIIVFVKSASFFSSNTFILKYFHLFYAGSVFYAWRRKLLSVFLIIPLLLLTIFHEYLLHGLIFMKPILFFYLLFIALQFNLLRYFPNKVFLFLGFISYPLYLLHQNLGYLIIFHLTKFGVNFHIGLVIAVIVSVFLAWVLAKYIEPMIQKKLKALIRKLS
jgi:peptidoglycan/LPS O-acetylase OafA/YrhL